MRKRFIRGSTWVPAALALALVMVLVCGSLSLAAGGGTGAAKAMAVATALMRKVTAVTAADPTDAGAAPGWRAATAGVPLLVYGLDGAASEYVVPVLDGSGTVISTIGVGATDFRWHWYNRQYTLDRFPLVSLPAARAQAGALAASRGIAATTQTATAVIAPDRNIYWRFEAGSLGMRQLYVPAFSEGAPFTRMATTPWKQDGGAPAVPPPAEGGSAGGPAPGNRQVTGQNGGAPSEYNIQGVPFHYQSTNYWCGPAALEMAFDYWGPDINQGQIASVADSGQDYGVYTGELARAAQFSNASGSVQDPSLRGYSARSMGYGMTDMAWQDGSAMYGRRYSDLKNLVSQNYPMVVLTWYDQTHQSGHFRVVKGYSDASDTIIFHDPWYSGPGPSGPDVALNQAYFVDNLWNYSDRWGMVTAPWGVSVLKPSSASAGQTFTVAATANYRGPDPLAGQYAAASPTATIYLPAGFTLVGGDVNQPIPGIGASGTSGSVTWTVRADVSKATTDISAVMQGRVSGATTSYPAYADWVGGSGSTADVPPFTPTSRTWGHDSIGVTQPARDWYMAEGCTAPGFETWILVQNPADIAANIDMVFQTENGQVQGPRDTVAPHTRKTYNVGGFVTGYNVSTRVTATSGQVICERAMYGNGRTWADDSIGATAPAADWYLAEGSTGEGFETWVLVQNPDATVANIKLSFQTDTGQVDGPSATVPPRSRMTFNLGAYVHSYNVSTRVTATTGRVICERSMYGSNRAWAHDSIGATAPASSWYLAEGCTAENFETWVLVQNPGATATPINMVFQTDNGQVQGPNETLPPHSRKSYNVKNYVTSYNVSTRVTATGGGQVICERSMYGNNRSWGHNSVGVTAPAPNWYLAEGCTGQGFETWILVQNPNANTANVTITYMTPGGPFLGPTVALPPRSRRSFNVYATVPATWEVSTFVSSDRPVIAERSMYGDPR